VRLADGLWSVRFFFIREKESKTCENMYVNIAGVTIYPIGTVR